MNLVIFGEEYFSSNDFTQLNLSSKLLIIFPLKLFLINSACSLELNSKNAHPLLFEGFLTIVLRGNIFILLSYAFKKVWFIHGSIFPIHKVL